MYAENKQNKQTIKRKNNPDYEAAVVHTRDGVKQTVYRKKANKDPPKKIKELPKKEEEHLKENQKEMLDYYQHPQQLPQVWRNLLVLIKAEVFKNKHFFNKIISNDYLEKQEKLNKENLKQQNKSNKLKREIDLTQMLEEVETEELNSILDFVDNYNFLDLIYKCLIVSCAELLYILLIFVKIVLKSLNYMKFILKK